MGFGVSGIVQRFAEYGYQINPDAASLITRYGATDEVIQNIIESLDESVLVVGPDHLNAIKEEEKQKAPDVKILKDITDISTCVGNYEEFVCYFRDRYSRLSEMIRWRINAGPIEALGKKRDGKEVNIVGMVSDVSTTSKGNKLLSVEDTTGECQILLLKDRDVIDCNILLDEVIGISGQLTNDGLFIANMITYPDIPYSNKPNTSQLPASVILTSDIHIGSKTFLEDSFGQFIKWINQDLPGEKQRKVASNVSYMVIAGDIIDGIGIYPNQEKELDILDVYEQYERAAEYLAEIPDHIQIIISPGNHDVVRQAEPQPAISKEIRKYFGKNVTFVGNPSLIELSGVKILIYHGRSLEDFFTAIPGVSYKKPDLAMAEMIKRRHLSPVYGSHVSIAPERNDHFLIDTIPDILHCGHIHTVGISKYRGVTLVNSGTWQDQTEYQKKLNIQPMPCYAPVVDLQTLGVSVLHFN